MMREGWDGRDDDRSAQLAYITRVFVRVGEEKESGGEGKRRRREAEEKGSGGEGKRRRRKATSRVR